VRERLGLAAVLVLIGTGWGLTTPLAKIAVSEGYGPLGLIFWQLVISGGLLMAVSALRGKGLPLRRRHLAFFLLIALLGTVVPNSASYAAARELPAGVLAILISTVPMFAFPIALGLGVDRFRVLRLFGLVCGLAGVVVLIGPRTSLPEPGMAAFIPLALVAPVFYAIEGNVVARWGTHGLDAVQVLAGASLIGAVVALPLALGSGQWIDPRPPWGAPDLALAASALVHAVVYSAYVWLVGRAGSVFAAQVSYLVTGFGVIWSMLLLSERYTAFVWIALALMLVGIFLVQPRPRIKLAPAAALREDTADRQWDGQI
jgi:drug/metabolite transporter (DMT)-like permease